MARRRTPTEEDHRLEGSDPRRKDDPRTDPAPGLRYDSLERRRATDGPSSAGLAMATVAIVVAVFVLILVL